MTNPFPFFSSLFSGLKSKLVLVLGAAVGILLLYVEHLKNKALKKELKATKHKHEVETKANEALSKGLQEEAKPVNRGYFDNKL